MTGQIRITREEYRGLRAVVLENEVLRAVVLPDRGGKTSSILYKPRDFELLADSANGYPPLKPGMEFSKGDASGFDDAFPSIDQGTVALAGKAIAYPDHGEIWTTSMKAGIQEDCVLLFCEGRVLPYRYQKEIRLVGNSIRYDYAITHTGVDPFPCLWACHCLLRYEQDMQLSYPCGMYHAENVLESPELGRIGAIHPLEGGTYGFHGVPNRKSETMIKYYLQGRLTEGRCGCNYPAQGVKMELAFDHDTLPYLGFWLTAGGYRGEYNCAFEPATGYYDSVSRAVKSGTAVMLNPGQTLSFSLVFSLFDLK